MFPPKPSSAILSQVWIISTGTIFFFYHLKLPEEKCNSGPLLSLRGARSPPIEGSEANWIYHWEKHLKSQINTCLFNAFLE